MSRLKVLNVVSLWKIVVIDHLPCVADGLRDDFVIAKRFYPQVKLPGDNSHKKFLVIAAFILCVILLLQPLTRIWTLGLRVSRHFIDCVKALKVKIESIVWRQALTKLFPGVFLAVDNDYRL